MKKFKIYDKVKILIKNLRKPLNSKLTTYLRSSNNKGIIVSDPSQIHDSTFYTVMFNNNDNNTWCFSEQCFEKIGILNIQKLIKKYTNQS